MQVGEERVFIFGTRAESVEAVRRRQQLPDFKVHTRSNLV
jgi:hypothetical protein